MADIRISPRGVACLWLSHIRWSRLIGVFLLCLIILAVISHNYLTDINSDPPDTHKSRIQLQHDEDDLQSQKLNKEIKSLRKIKASVNNELRDMENKRQKLQFQISGYQKQVRNRESDLFKASVNNELRDMENKRQKLQFQISGYQKQVRNRESGLFKASVNNELRDMENKRQKLQFQISGYQKQVRNRESGLFKASINNELRDMENKRQKLQFQISGYQKQRIRFIQSLRQQ
jgi:chromosome segregation ATPase